jgi:hypothetical protein
MVERRFRKYPEYGTDSFKECLFHRKFISDPRIMKRLMTPNYVSQKFKFYFSRIYVSIKIYVSKKNLSVNKKFHIWEKRFDMY